jgi:hypothetical protein
MGRGGRHREGPGGLENFHGVHDVGNDGALLLGNSDTVDVQKGMDLSAEKKGGVARQ